MSPAHAGLLSFGGGTLRAVIRELLEGARAARTTSSTRARSTRSSCACCGRSASTASGRAPRGSTSTTRKGLATSTCSAASGCSTSAATTRACAPRWSRRSSSRRRARCSSASHSLPGLLAEELLKRDARHGSSASLFTSSGTEAVEAALKLGRAATGRSRVVSTDHGFHGLTLGSLSANGEPRFVERFGPLAPGLLAGALRRPRRARDANCAAKTSRSSSSSRFRARASTCRRTGYLEAAQELCRRYGTLFAVDEVQTGLRAHRPAVRVRALGTRAGPRHRSRSRCRAGTSRSARC